MSLIKKTEAKVVPAVSVPQVSRVELAFMEDGTMPFEEWKEAIDREIKDRFGRVPFDLVALSKAGW